MKIRITGVHRGYPFCYVSDCGEYINFTDPNDSWIGIPLTVPMQDPATAQSACDFINAAAERYCIGEESRAAESHKVPND